MSIGFPSALIRYERRRRSWSQEGLCEGICAVSYLSKIEQGKAEPGPEIWQRLMERLELAWVDSPRAQPLADELEEAVFSMDREAIKKLLAELKEDDRACLKGPHMLRLLLLEHLCGGDAQPEVPLSAFLDCFTPHERALWLLGEDRPSEALALLPNAYVWVASGAKLYRQGQYSLAIEQLMRGAAMAAEEGRARLMLYARMLLGNCHSDRLDLSAMLSHYQAATRLAKELGETDMVEGVRYNIASTQLTMGHVEEAYAYFASVEKPSVIEGHKLAVCLEKMGRREEALQAILAAEQTANDYPESGEDDPGHEWLMRLCTLVKYRLEHPGYLRDSAYGEKLLSTFQRMRTELPHGFVLFHLPWVEEWYINNRQYRQAYELRKEFS